jgi:hypothetical protein
VSRRPPRLGECKTMDDLVRGGFALPVLPTTDTGYKSYGAGRLFLPAATNYASNPSFETDTDADGKADNVSTQHSVEAPTFTRPSGRTGGLCQRVQYAPVAGDWGISINPSYTIYNSFASGEPITVSTYLKGALVGCTITPRIKFMDNDWNLLSESSAASPASVGTEWTRASHSVASTPANTKWVEFWLDSFDIHVGDSFDLYIDDVQIEKSAVLTPYFDGSYPACAWTGTADASTSTRAVSALVYPPWSGTPGAYGTMAARWTPLFPAAQTTVARYLLVGESAVGGNQSFALLRSAGTSPTRFAARATASVTASSLDQSYLSGERQVAIGRWSGPGSGGTVDLTTNGVAATQADLGTQVPSVARAVHVGASWVPSLWTETYIGPLAISPSRITDAETTSLSTLLAAGAGGIEVFRFFRERGYAGTLILPLQGDSVGYRVV